MSRPLTYQHYRSKIKKRQVHCSSCYEVNYGKLVYTGHEFDIIQCSSCGYSNEVR